MFTMNLSKVFLKTRDSSKWAYNILSLLHSKQLLHSALTKLWARKGWPTTYTQTNNIYQKKTFNPYKINLSLSRIRISSHHESNKGFPIYSGQQPHQNTQNSLVTTSSAATNHYFGNHNEQRSTTKNNRDRGKTIEGYKIHRDTLEYTKTYSWGVLDQSRQTKIYWKQQPPSSNNYH